MDNGLLRRNKKRGQWANDLLVLILIVMDNGLLLHHGPEQGQGRQVLILIVMDNGLLQRLMVATESLVLILIVMDNGLLP